MSDDINDANENKLSDIGGLNLSELGAAWRSYTPKVEVDFKAAHAQQQRRRMWFFLDLFQAIVMILAGIGFLMFLPTSTITTVAGLVLLLSGLVVGQQAFSIHSQVINYEDWTAAGLLEFRCLNHRASIRHLRINQAGCLVPLTFTLALFLFEVLGFALVPASVSAIFYYLTVPILLLLAYFQLRVNRRVKLLNQAEDMRKEFEEE